MPPPEGVYECNDKDCVFSLYGDPAYPQSLYVFGGYKNPPPGGPHKHSTGIPKCRSLEKLSSGSLFFICWMIYPTCQRMVGNGLTLVGNGTLKHIYSVNDDLYNCNYWLFALHFVSSSVAE